MGPAGAARGSRSRRAETADDRSIHTDDAGHTLLGRSSRGQNALLLKGDADIDRAHRGRPAVARGAADRAFPITIDPTLHRAGGAASRSDKSDGYVCDPCPVKVGNPTSRTAG